MRPVEITVSDTGVALVVDAEAFGGPYVWVPMSEYESVFGKRPAIPYGPGNPLVKVRLCVWEDAVRGRNGG